MKLLPYDAFTIQSPYTPEEIVERLARDTEPLDLLRSVLSTQNLPLFDRQVSQHKYFEGDYDAEGFELRRVTAERNNFRPVAFGKIERSANGSTVHVHMRPGLYALTLAVVFGVVGAYFVIAVVGQLWGALIPILLWAIAAFGFWDDAGGIKTLLHVILERLD